MIIPAIDPRENNQFITVARIVTALCVLAAIILASILAFIALSVVFAKPADMASEIMPGINLVDAWIISATIMGGAIFALLIAAFWSWTYFTKTVLPIRPIAQFFSSLCNSAAVFFLFWALSILLTMTLSGRVPFLNKEATAGYIIFGVMGALFPAVFLATISFLITRFFPQKK